MTNRIPATTFYSAHWLVAINRLFTFVLLLVLLQTSTHAEPLLLQGRIVRVADGDTVTLLDERQTLHKIRLASIDAPETAMPYGKHATLYLMTLVAGKNVEAMIHKQDRYGRKVATLMLGAQDVNLAMIQTGLAWHYKRYRKEQPAAQAQAYARAEEQARTKNLALWQDSNAIPPWDWRKNRRARPSQVVETIMLGEFATSADTTQ